jgi:hypothetical protein
MTRGVRGWLLLAGLLVAGAVLGLRLPELLVPVALPPLVLPTPAGDAATVIAIPLPELPDSEVLDPALDRPPLHQSRRPYQEPDTPAQPAAPPTPLDAALWGIVASDDELFAVLAERGASTGVRVRPGDVFDGWTVVSISDAAIVLQRGDRTETLRLAFGPAPGAQTSD